MCWVNWFSNSGSGKFDKSKLQLRRTRREAAANANSSRPVVNISNSSSGNSRTKNPQQAPNASAASGSNPAKPQLSSASSSNAQTIPWPQLPSHAFNLPSAQDFQQVTLHAQLLSGSVCSNLFWVMMWDMCSIFDFVIRVVFFYFRIRLTSTSRTTFWSVSATVRSARPFHIFMISEHVDAFRHL